MVRVSRCAASICFRHDGVESHAPGAAAGSMSNAAAKSSHAPGVQ
jgi:hypothetical protein